MENSNKYDTGDIRTFYVWSENEKIRLGNETVILLKVLLILS